VAEEGGAPSRPRPWTQLEVQDLLIGLGAVFVSVGVAGSIVLSFFSSDPDKTLAGLGVQNILFLAVPLAVVAARVRDRPWRALGFVPFRLRDMGLVGLALLAQIAVASVLTAEQDQLVDENKLDATTISIVLTVLLFVVLGPIAEETLFRGLLFGGPRRYAPFWVAAGVTGALFGAAHLSTGDLAAAGLLAFLGVLLAGLYERSGSLGPPIALHMINNLAATVLLLA
jgi:uncharacterized protein